MDKLRTVICSSALAGAAVGAQEYRADAFDLHLTATANGVVVVDEPLTALSGEPDVPQGYLQLPTGELYAPKLRIEGCCAIEFSLDIRPTDVSGQGARAFTDSVLVRDGETASIVYERLDAITYDFRLTLRSIFRGTTVVKYQNAPLPPGALARIREVASVVPEIATAQETHVFSAATDGGERWQAAVDFGPYAGDGTMTWWKRANCHRETEWTCARIEDRAKVYVPTQRELVDLSGDVGAREAELIMHALQRPEARRQTGASFRLIAIMKLWGDCYRAHVARDDGSHVPFTLTFDGAAMTVQPLFIDICR